MPLTEAEVQQKFAEIGALETPQQRFNKYREWWDGLGIDDRELVGDYPNLGDDLEALSLSPEFAEFDRKLYPELYIEGGTDRWAAAMEAKLVREAREPKLLAAANQGLEALQAFLASEQGQ